jgi:hypothetical protein
MHSAIPTMPNGSLLQGFDPEQSFVVDEEREAVTVPELARLHARFEALHRAELLTAAELHTLEDLIADFSDVRQSLLPWMITYAMVNQSGQANRVAEACLDLNNANLTSSVKVKVSFLLFWVGLSLVLTW